MSPGASKMESLSFTTDSYSAFSHTIATLLNPQQWNVSPDRLRTPKPWLVPLLLGTFITSALFSRKIRIFVFTPLLCLLLNQLRSATGNNVAEDYGIAQILFGQYVLKFLDFGLLREEREMYKLNDGRKEKRSGDEKQERIEKSLWRKLGDSLEFWVLTSRGIGWNWEVKSIPPRTTQSRGSFLLSTAFRLALDYLIFDINKNLIAHFYPYTTRPEFLSLPFTTQATLAILHYIDTYSWFCMPYHLIAFITVSLKIYEPSEWPPMFGKLSDAYTVSRFWGRVWHQCLRRAVTFPTPYIQSLFPHSSRSTKRTIVLFTAFTTSGLAHWIPTLNTPYHPAAAGWFLYFIAQTFVIRVEDYVIDFGTQRGWSSGRWRIVGYVWTFAWLAFSIRYSARWTFETGPLSLGEELDGSAVRWVMRKMR